MKFHLSDEQEMIRDTFDRALRDVIGDRFFHMLDASDDFDRPVWDAMVGLGLPGLLVDEADGGAGLGMVEAAITSEMLGHHAAPGPLVPQMLVAMAIARSGNPSLKAELLPGLLSGEIVGAFAAGGGWMPESWTGEIADGMLTGRYPFVQGAEQADVFVVATAGPGLAVVLREASGVSVTPLPSADFSRHVAQVDLAGAVAKPIGDAALAQAVFSAALVLQAADALGGAQACLDKSVAYALERHQFGVPIGQFQAVKHQLADLLLMVEPGRALVWYAAYALDSGADDARCAISQAKAHMTTCFNAVVRRAVQIHGGIGYTWELGLHLWLRRALVAHAYLGSPAAHRERALQACGL